MQRGRQLPQLSNPPAGSTSTPAVPPASSAASPASASWQEAWPAKLSTGKTAELRRRFEDDYPTELLDAEVFPSSRLLALTSNMVADKEIRWLPWRFRLSAKAQDDNLFLKRPKKLPRLHPACRTFCWMRLLQGIYMMGPLHTT